jgi:hypothetical protein
MATQHRRTMKATVSTEATIVGEVTKFITIVRKLPATAAAFIAGTTPIVASTLKAWLAHHPPLGPVADVAEEATNRGGEYAADQLMRRAVTVVKRTTRFDA